MSHAIHPCNEADFSLIYKGLREFNISRIPMTQADPFIDMSRKVVDENGALIAGCIAEMYFWKIVNVEILWVDEPYRGQELGRELLLAVERAAQEAGCSLIHLDTFDFQARDFYLKLGYEIFGTLEDCPEGHCRYYLRKKLN